MSRKFNATISIITISLMLCILSAPIVDAGVGITNTVMGTETGIVMGQSSMFNSSGCTHIHHNNPEKFDSCSRCSGSGKCQVCGGSGKINEHECSICNGSGKCHYCDGDGELWN